MASTIEIFICYSHQDEILWKGLEKQLRALMQQGLLDIWYDRNISAGTVWEKELDKHLNTAQVILLLVSPDFMASDYCYRKEMQQAMERHEQGVARVIPVILRPVYWKRAPFSKLQVLPTDANPLTSAAWHNLDEAFFDVAEGIRKAVEELTLTVPTNVGPLRIDRQTADRKVDEARKKVQQWGERIKREGEWDWYLLGHALQLAHEAIENDPTYQRAWTLLADIYHRIGKIELGRRCLKKSYSLSTPGPNFPGRFYNAVSNNFKSNYPFNSAGGLKRQSSPTWFEVKYQRYWQLEQYD